MMTNGYDKDEYYLDGFNDMGIHKETGTRFDPEGYDIFGYDKDGYKKNGFNFNLINKDTKDKYDPDGFDAWGYDKDGYDRDGYNRKGFNKEGIHKTTRKKYDKSGRDVQGKSEEDVRTELQMLEDEQNELREYLKKIQQLEKSVSCYEGNTKDIGE